jgi:hypothetical protein
MRRAWIGAVGALALVATGLNGGASATTVLAPPAPCFGVPQITDPNGDGHHDGTDVLQAWFSLEAGPLQGVIKVKSGLWMPQHDDADVNGAGYVLLFTTGGQTWFVRAFAAPGGALTYDYGTYGGGAFTSLGPTTGTVVYGTGGTVTIDIPAATGATAGAVLANPFVLTYDGVIGGVPTWVDHAPGGTGPNDSARGADYTVAACGTGGTTAAVQLTGPARIVGGGKNATITGKALPGRAGVGVALTRTNVTTKVFNTTTGADGSFTFVVPVHETTRVRATAEGISSQTLTITVKSTVRIFVRRLASGAARISGRISPALPGRVLILKTTAFRPTKTITRFRAGKFSVLLPRPRKGRYQAVYIPKGGRAERSTSNTIRIR